MYCLTEFDPLLQVEVRQFEKRASECVFSIFLTTTFLAALVDLLTQLSFPDFHRNHRYSLSSIDSAGLVTI
jgi:hypothetical protein